jgi:CubicO group peptidase (beta-lactamase class C family)
LAALLLSLPFAVVALGQPHDGGHESAAARPGLLPSPIMDLHEVVLPPEVRPEALNRADSAELRTDSTQQDDPLAMIDGCMTREMEREKGIGGAIAILRDGQLVYAKGYGIKDEETDEAVDADTQFRIGSVTKMFTAAAVMQQVEAGTVDLQAPITRYLPDYQVADEGATAKVTTWHLLAQSSGLPDNGFSGSTALELFDGPRTDEALTDWLATQHATHVHAPPGTLWNYSNPNFMLAGLVAERASGIPYHQYMAERVFAKAGLTNTTLLPTEVITRGNFTRGYWIDPFTGQPASFAPDSYDRWDVAPAGYAFSTVGDLARWAQLLMDGGGAVLTPSSAAAMQARQQPMHYTPEDDYGFGIFAEEYKGLDVRQHGGNVPGWGAYLLWVPSERFVVATLVNAYPATLNGSAYCAVDALLAPPDDPPPDYSTPPETWDKYLGEYAGWVVNGEFLRALVAKEGMTMTFTLPDVPIDAMGTAFTSPLWQAALDTFLFDNNLDGAPDTDITFIQDPKEPDNWWIRNRQWVLRRPALPAPTPVPPRFDVYLPRVLRGEPAQ